MKLKIKNVTDFGTHSSERVWIEVTADCNLEYYMITDTTFTGENSISNKVRHMHWFAPKEVKTGDEVVLMTRKGSETKEVINGGKNTRYYIYWGSIVMYGTILVTPQYCSKSRLGKRPK